MSKPQLATTSWTRLSQPKRTPPRRQSSLSLHSRIRSTNLMPRLCFSKEEPLAMLRTQLLRPLCTWRARGGILHPIFFFFTHGYLQGKVQWLHLRIALSFLQIPMVGLANGHKSDGSHVSSVSAAHMNKCRTTCTTAATPRRSARPSVGHP